MIHLHAKHGLNPGMLDCFVCNKPKGIVFHGAIGHSKQESLKKAGIHVPPDGEAPRHLCMDYEPCPECAEYMKQGVILISVREPGPKDDPKNPYRTGGWVVVKDEAISRLVQPQELADDILKKRMAFVPDDAWDMLGLPRGQKKEEG